MRRIVFVHLGPSPAEHLWMNIRSIKKRFPDMKITVIYSDDIHKPKILEREVNSFHYKALGDDNLLLGSLTNNVKFRGGFWRYSLERLIALEAWHEENSPAESFLHPQQPGAACGQCHFVRRSRSRLRSQHGSPLPFRSRGRSPGFGSGVTPWCP